MDQGYRGNIGIEISAPYVTTSNDVLNIISNIGVVSNGQASVHFGLDMEGVIPAGDATLRIGGSSIGEESENNGGNGTLNIGGSTVNGNGGSGFLNIGGDGAYGGLGTVNIGSQNGGYGTLNVGGTYNGNGTVKIRSGGSELTLTHTGDGDENLTQRISRDAKYAITNDTQLWQDCVSPIADYAALYNRTEAYVYSASSNAVQYLTLGGGTNLVITPPASVSGKVMDWVVYANAEGGNAVTLTNSVNWYATDAAVTNALDAGVTAFYFSQIGTGRFAVGRQKLENIITAE